MLELCSDVLQQDDTSVCVVLKLWRVWVIPTEEVYRLTDSMNIFQTLSTNNYELKSQVSGKSPDTKSQIRVSSQIFQVRVKSHTTFCDSCNSSRQCCRVPYRIPSESREGIRWNRVLPHGPDMSALQSHEVPLNQI